ncbi:MAG TPA: helix-hairpin-helix domain-containing protein [Candidatus Fraserbacteria bacterium]|nr:helix-hairpin-helix domain-containing protein [Candidatus Fraserbacteria bacterium]
MPFSQADGRALLLLGSLALLVAGLSLLLGGAPSVPRQPAPVEPAGSTIWLNLASARELESLPGIGPVIARRIVSYRLLHGPFRSLAELERVPGIGPQTLTNIRAQVRFDCPAALC